MKTTLREGADSVEAITSRTAAENYSHAPEAQPSPLPWRVQYENGRPLVMSGLYYVTTTAVSPGDLDSEGREQYSHEANAAFIVRACNHHEALLDELQRFVNYYAQQGRAAQLGNGEAFQHWDRARALLARIDGANAEEN